MWGSAARDAVQDALDVDIDHAIPFVDLKALERGLWHQARVVQHHIDAAVGFDSGIDKRGNLSTVKVVGLDCDGFATLGDDILCNRLKPIDAPRAQYDSCALRGQKAGRCLSQSAACTGDDDDFVLNSRCHVRPPATVSAMAFCMAQR
jgi:hypothetical protein